MKSSKAKIKRERRLTDERRQLVENYYAYAVHLSRRFAPLARSRSIPLEDLQQEACLGLCEAALRFNKNVKVDFMTYAYMWCYKYIIATIRKQFINADEDMEFLPDIIADDDQEEARAKVRKMMSVLNEKECAVIRLIYGFDGDCLNFSDVAQKLHLSPGRVHALYDNAMNKMEHTII